MSLGHLIVPESMEMLKKNKIMGHVKVTGIKRKDLPMAKAGDNNEQQNNGVLDYNPRYKTHKFESI